MFLRQFLLLRFTLPGGVARARGENGSAAPPVDDDGVRKDDDTGQLKCSDAGLLCAGISDAVSTQKKAKTAAPGHRQKATSGDNGAQKAKKARVAPKGK